MLCCVVRRIKLLFFNIKKYFLIGNMFFNKKINYKFKIWYLLDNIFFLNIDIVIY
jgi:hypothetical protein